jgi:hypothetical protein
MSGDNGQTAAAGGGSRPAQPDRGGIDTWLLDKLFGQH